jgi:N-formylglutamate deformylase
MILHIPHSSRIIPENLRNQIVLSDDDLSAELALMTDVFTDELFTLPETSILRFPISRLLVDVERFPDDADEPMSKVGMGMIYTLTAYGKKLKRALQPHEIRNLVSQYYDPHHQALSAKMRNELENCGKALIVDCHSFPSKPLPCDIDQSIPRAEFCIGTDSFHTPRALIQITARSIKKMGYSVGINKPYSGSLVPIAFYKKNRRVASIMIEVNRSLYMDELVGTKTGRFNHVKGNIQTLVGLIGEFQQQTETDPRGDWRGVT